MTRVIGGVAGGRRLRTPAGPHTRPTSDRVREAMFSALTSRDAIAGLSVLDLYAGSGALGLEALSRGASAVTMVESDRRAAQVTLQNVEVLALPGAQVVPATVATYLARPADTAYGLVLLDPPYAVGEPDLAAVLERLVTGGWLTEQAVVVVERSSRTPEPTWPEGLTPDGSRTYGETVVWYAVAA